MKKLFYVFLTVLLLTSCKNHIYVYSGDVKEITRLTICECSISTVMSEDDIIELARVAVEQGSRLGEMIGGTSVEVRKDNKLYRFEIYDKKDRALLNKTWNHFRYQKTWLRKDNPEE